MSPSTRTPLGRGPSSLEDREADGCQLGGLRLPPPNMPRLLPIPLPHDVTESRGLFPRRPSLPPAGLGRGPFSLPPSLTRAPPTHACHPTGSHGHHMIQQWTPSTHNSPHDRTLHCGLGWMCMAKVTAHPSLGASCVQSPGTKLWARGHVPSSGSCTGALDPSLALPDPGRAECRRGNWGRWHWHCCGVSRCHSRRVSLLRVLPTVGLCTNCAVSICKYSIILHHLKATK